MCFHLGSSMVRVTTIPCVFLVEGDMLGSPAIGHDIKQVINGQVTNSER